MLTTTIASLVLVCPRSLSCLPRNSHSNFYRIHLGAYYAMAYRRHKAISHAHTVLIAVCFTLIPLIFACIFWAIDKNDTSFVDALFVCVSSSEDRLFQKTIRH